MIQPIYHQAYNHSDEITASQGKFLVALWITLHVLPALYILVSYIKTRLYDQSYWELDDCDLSVVTLGVVLGADVLFGVAYLISLAL